LISYKWSLRKWRREVDGLIIIVFSWNTYIWFLTSWSLEAGEVL
jgi:hypothetical protein